MVHRRDRSHLCYKLFPCYCEELLHAKEGEKYLSREFLSSFRDREEVNMQIEHPKNMMQAASHHFCECHSGNSRHYFRIQNTYFAKNLSSAQETNSGGPGVLLLVCTIRGAALALVGTTGPHEISLPWSPVRTSRSPVSTSRKCPSAKGISQIPHLFGLFSRICVLRARKVSEAGSCRGAAGARL